MAAEIAKAAEDTGCENVVVVPFAHLSNNLAKSEDALISLSMIEKYLKKDFNTIRAHFGSHKSLLLDVFGHPGNVRFREF